MNLKPEDKIILLKLCSLLETPEKRISQAEAIRQAIHIAYEYKSAFTRAIAKITNL